MTCLKCNDRFKYFRKGGILLSFLFTSLYNAQVIQRFSDGQEFDSITINNNRENSLLTKLNFKKTIFHEGEKVLYQDRLLDFAVENDTLVFFDKVKEIESVDLISKQKTEYAFKTKKRRNTTGSIFTNILNATSVHVFLGNKNSFVKSITIYPTKQFYFEGKMKIDLLNIKNGLPDDSSPILSFEKNLTEIKMREWEIILPKIIKYPKEGFVISFSFENKKIGLEGSRFLNYKCTNESTGFTKCCDNGWSVVNFPGMLYKLKILQ